MLIEKRKKYGNSGRGKPHQPHFFYYRVNSGVLGIMWKIRANDKREFEKHKDSVQYKDTCDEVVKRIDEKSEERHKTVTKTLERIERLIKNNGNTRPRVQT
jgi:hypothetical protein